MTSPEFHVGAEAPASDPTSVPAAEPAPSLLVVAAHDHAEHDADRVASAVLARLHGRVEPAAGAGAPHAHIARLPAPSGGGSPEVGAAGGPTSGQLSTRITQKTGGGEHLPAAVRARMEEGFGRSLGNVRIHRDAEAAALNRAVSARAFTTGSDIFFGAGQYAPGTPGGDHVLAHELAHTIQTNGTVSRLFGSHEKDTTTGAIAGSTTDSDTTARNQEQEREATLTAAITSLPGMVRDGLDMDWRNLLEVPALPELLAVRYGLEEPQGRLATGTLVVAPEHSRPLAALRKCVPSTQAMPLWAEEILLKDPALGQELVKRLEKIPEARQSLEAFETFRLLVRATRHLTTATAPKQRNAEGKEVEMSKPRVTAPDGAFLAFLIARGGRIGAALEALTAKKELLGKEMRVGDMVLLFEAFHKTPGWRYNISASADPDSYLRGSANSAVCGGFAAVLLRLVDLVRSARSLTAPSPLKLKMTSDAFVSHPYNGSFIDPSVFGTVVSGEHADDHSATGSLADERRILWKGHTWTEWEPTGTVFDSLGNEPGRNYKDYDVTLDKVEFWKRTDSLDAKEKLVTKNIWRAADGRCLEELPSAGFPGASPAFGSVYALRQGSGTPVGASAKH